MLSLESPPATSQIPTMRAEALKNRHNFIALKYDFRRPSHSLSIKEIPYFTRCRKGGREEWY